MMTSLRSETRQLARVFLTVEIKVWNINASLYKNSYKLSSNYQIRSVHVEAEPGEHLGEKIVTKRLFWETMCCFEYIIIMCENLRRLLFCHLSIQQHHCNGSVSTTFNCPTWEHDNKEWGECQDDLSVSPVRLIIGDSITCPDVVKMEKWFG